MPIEYQVTMYKCKYRCGKYSRSKRFIQGHERHCWKNPALRTCKTCQYENYFPDSSGTTQLGDYAITEPDWWERHCEHPSRGDIRDNIEAAIDAIYAKVELDNPDNAQIPPVVDCPYWEGKE